ncbi:MAG TPA: membrane protein insertase YidC [Longimicrobiales bacterium]|nr:membrane protein insertase YidC [Longimicrobiales bacterium]
MDSGRFLLAVVLMIAVMIVTQVLLPPPPREQPPASGTTADSIRGTAPAADSAPPTTIAPAAPVATADPAAPAVPADTIRVRTELYEYDVSTRGAAIVGARLLHFESQRPGWDGRPVELSPDSLPGLYSYRLLIGTREIRLNELAFTSTQTEPPVAGTDRVLELRHETADGLGITVAYSFDANRYMVDARIAVSGLGEQSPALLIELPRTLASHEANPKEDERFLSYVFNSDREGIGTFRLTSVKAEHVQGGPLHWVAIKNKYFVTAVLTHPQATQPFESVVATPIAPKLAAANLTARLLPSSDRTFSFRIYMGPREPERLAELGNRLDDVNQIGWKPFRPILTPLGHAIQWALTGLHDLLGIGYGWVLVLFGVIIRIVLWPLNAKAMRSQMKNMEIQPRLKEIQAKYKNEPEKLQKEMLRLYREEGFNPMGGCLPMLIPLPILITLFFVFQSTIVFRGVSFLWLPDLSRADPLYILPVLLGLSMYLMQWLSTKSMTEQNPQMKFMMYAMPPFMTILFLNFASGLNLYYAAMNFASIPQQIQIMKERQKFNAARAK